jgi:hypothetical protein
MSSAMTDSQENRGSKRVCTASADPDSKILPLWRRLCNKLMIQQHLVVTMKLLIGMAMPLMFLLKQVLSMMMRVADVEEMEVMQDLMCNMVTEKKQLEKGHKYKKPSSKESVGSFELISECSTAPSRQKDKGRRSQASQPSAATSSYNVDPSSTAFHLDQSCFCGLIPIQYTSRKEGRNFMRLFLRCPKQPESGSQCEFFQWIEDTKAQEYERMYHQRATLERSPKHKNTKSTSSRPLEIDSSSSGTEEPMVRQSPSSSPKIKGSKRGGHCHHDWNNRGSNAYQKMRTCRLCGLQEVTKYKDQITVQRWAEPTAKPSKTSKSKKEPLRSESP